MTVKRQRNKFRLVLFDLFAFILSFVLMFVFYSSDINPRDLIFSRQMLLMLGSIFLCRYIFGIYKQIWRFGGIQCYIRLLATDTIAYVVYYLIEIALPIKKIPFARTLAFFCVDLLGALAMRMLYRYAYRNSADSSFIGKILRTMLRAVGASHLISRQSNVQKIRIAIVGAGRVGTGLAEELLSNSKAAYQPCCFIDSDPAKIGREIFGITVYGEDKELFSTLAKLEIQEIVFALPEMTAEQKKKTYERYRAAGFRIQVYDYPVVNKAGDKRQMREFAIEDLLFRKPITIADEHTREFYHGKVILITGGGGSIGSELCRQIASMQPKQLIILDVYENGAYSVQQELRMKYGNELDLQVEILSVCNKTALERVFDKYRPQLVLNAAAHKHVPLMEHNCIEAIENNVFGTLNSVMLSEKYGVERFIMVSTDKAVNPTNVMGATKRMCEMIVQSHSQTGGKTTFSATRFGNVLGSAGSVIPLFKMQIAAGGPVTLTDRRITRYFMTIPEASQLVLQSGAMAKNNELFVLDMGKPVNILDLAENLIRFSGYEPDVDIEIKEIGLRPGEKLYEELLVRTEELDKTENSLIFIERDTPISSDELEEKLRILREAVATGDDDIAREALHKVVPTFKTPEEVNGKA